MLFLNVKYLIAFLFLLPLISFSHGGRTDSKGGHNDNINGGYHYHHGNPAHSHANGCPYSDSYTPKSSGSNYSFWISFGEIIGFAVIALGIIIPLYTQIKKYQNKKAEKHKRKERFLFLARKKFNQNGEKIVPNPLTDDEQNEFDNLMKYWEIDNWQFKQEPIKTVYIKK